MLGYADIYELVLMTSKPMFSGFCIILKINAFEQPASQLLPVKYIQVCTYIQLYGYYTDYPNK